MACETVQSSEAQSTRSPSFISWRLEKLFVTIYARLSFVVILFSWLDIIFVIRSFSWYVSLRFSWHGVLVTLKSPWCPGESDKFGAGDPVWVFRDMDRRSGPDCRLTFWHQTVTPRSGRRYLETFFHNRVRQQKNESGVFQLLAPQRLLTPKFSVLPIRFPDPHPIWWRWSAQWTHERCRQDLGFGFCLVLMALRSTSVSQRSRVRHSRRNLRWAWPWIRTSAICIIWPFTGVDVDAFSWNLK